MAGNAALLKRISYTIPCFFGCGRGKGMAFLRLEAASGSQY